MIGTSGDDQFFFPVFDIGRTSGVVVAGLTGDDVIELSSDEDTFVFREGDGHDTVDGLNLDEDQVVLYGFDTPIDAQLVTINGDLPFTFDTTVNFSDGDSITFKGFDLDDVEFLLENNVTPTGAFDDFLM